MPLDTLIAGLRSRADRLGGRLRGVVAGLLAVAVLCMVAARLLPGAVPPALPVLLGGIGGMVLFVAGYWVWYGLLPDGAQDTLNWRGRFPPATRRLAAVGLLAVWFAVVLLVSRWVGGPVLGGITVAVGMSLWRMSSMTDQEWDALADEPYPGEEPSGEPAEGPYGEPSGDDGSEGGGPVSGSRRGPQRPTF